MTYWVCPVTCGVAALHRMLLRSPWRGRQMGEQYCEIPTESAAGAAGTAVALAAFPADFSAFLAAFLSSFLDGPFGSAATLIGDEMRHDPRDSASSRRL